MWQDVVGPAENMRLILTLVTALLLGTSCGRRTDVQENQVIVDPIEPTPKFPGDASGLKKYLKENYKWQQGQLTVEGTVFVSFLVSEDGKISDVKIARGLCAPCDQEAMRLVKEMPNWEPAIHEGKPISTRMTLPIKFGLTNPYE